MLPSTKSPDHTYRAYSWSGARSKAKTPRHATPRFRPNRARFLRQWRKRSESRERIPKNTISLWCCGCHWLRLCSDFSVLWTTGSEVESQWSCNSQVLGMSKEKTPVSICGGASTPLHLVWRPRDRFIPADFYHDSLQPYESSFIHASLARLGLWFGGFSFVRKLQQTSRLMMQTSSFYLASRFDQGYLIVCMDTIQKKAIKHCRKHFHLMPRSMHYCPFQLILEFLTV